MAASGRVRGFHPALRGCGVVCRHACGGVWGGGCGGRADPFGWGLSYTTFSYQWSNSTALPSVLHTSAFSGAASPMPAFEVSGVVLCLVICCAAALLQVSRVLPPCDAQVNVTNTGSVTGDCVVLAFVQYADTHAGRLAGVCLAVLFLCLCAGSVPPMRGSGRCILNRLRAVCLRLLQR
jgi:hypothetical protein